MIPALHLIFNVVAKGLPIGISGDLDFILVAPVNGIRCFTNEGVSASVKDRIIACIEHFRKLGQVIEVIRGAYWGLNLQKARQKKFLRENRCWGWNSVNRRSTTFRIIACYMYSVSVLLLSQFICGLPIVYHCVVMDASRALLLYSVKTCQIRISAETLQMSDGPNTPMLEVAEVLQVVIE